MPVIKNQDPGRRGKTGKRMKFRFVIPAGIYVVFILFQNRDL